MVDRGLQSSPAAPIIAASGVYWWRPTFVVINVFLCVALGIGGVSVFRTQGDLSFAYERMGDIQVARGDTGAAKPKYELAMADLDRLMRAAPGQANLEPRQNLAMTSD